MYDVYVMSDFFSSFLLISIFSHLCFSLCLVFLTCTFGWKILPSGHLLKPPRGGNVLTTNHSSLIREEAFLFLWDY